MCTNPGLVNTKAHVLFLRFTSLKQRNFSFIKDVQLMKKLFSIPIQLSISKKKKKQLGLQHGELRLALTLDFLITKIDV